MKKIKNLKIFLSLLYIYTLNLDLEPSMLPKQEVLNPYFFFNFHLQKILILKKKKIQNRPSLV